MRVRVRFDNPDFAVDQVFEGSTADDVVAQMKSAVAAKLGFALRIVVNSMSPLRFAQEVVSRYNESLGKNVPTPANCREFIELGEIEGIAEVISE